MSSIVMTVPDPWGANTESLSDLIPTLNTSVSEGNGPGYAAVIKFDPIDAVGPGAVRRPTTGISVKPNTHAYATVVSDTGKVINVFNDLGSSRRPDTVVSSDPGGNASTTADPQSRYWTDFLLQTVTESRQEKIQIVETFGEPVIFVFGERPRFLQFTGVLINTADFPWKAEFWENWDRYFRATKLVERKARMYMMFDDVLISGYPISATSPQSTNDPNKVSFSFQFYVTTYINITMKNAGSFQALQDELPSLHSFPTYVSRRNEFLSSGSFRDDSYELGAKGDGSLADAIGGNRLKALQTMQDLQNALSLGDFGTYDLMFNHRLRYIKGTKTAIAAVLAYQRQLTNKAAYAGVEELAAKTDGGIQGLNFWFNLIGHLYKVVAVNAVRMVGGRSSPAENRWVGLIDHLAQLGNPYAVATTLGYTVDVALSGALYSTTNKYELNNLSNNFQHGLVARGQDESFGQTISFRTEGVAVQDTDSASSVSVANNFVSVSSVGDSTGYAQPEGMNGPESDPGAKTMSAFDFDRKVDSEVSEREAVELQNERSQRNHGLIIVVEDPEELEDDGSE